MGFAEDLTATIQAAQAEREKEERERREFEAEWQKVRKADLLPMFQDAATVFEATMGGGRAELHNGSIVLEASRDGIKHSLTFMPDKKETIIRCSSTLEGDSGETFSVDGLSSGTVRHKLLEFAASVVRGRWEERSVYSDRGIFAV